MSKTTENTLSSTGILLLVPRINIAHLLAVFASTLLFVTACKEMPTPEPTPSGPAEITIQAATYQHHTIDNTKVSWNTTYGQRYISHWGKNEEINVFYNGTSYKFTSQNILDTVVAPFAGILDLGGKNLGDEGVAFWGLYPYDSNAVFDGQSFTTTVPDNQNGTFGILMGLPREIQRTKASDDGIDLFFYDVLFNVIFSFSKGGIIDKVTFEGNQGEQLAGTIKIQESTDHPKVELLNDGKTLITITPPDGQYFEANRDYSIAIIPRRSRIKDEYTLTLYSGEKKVKIINTSSSESSYDPLVPSAFYEIPTINVDNLDRPESIIQFVDPTAKSACVEKFDTNGDGKVSNWEAFQANSLAGLFDKWNTVKRFDEIKYFTRVTSTKDVFYGLKQLESITIPSFIEELGSFSGCSSLKNVVLPEGVSLPFKCFDGCISLNRIDLPSDITSIPEACFRDCQSLTSITLPSSINSIGKEAFSLCKGLVSITMQSKVTELPEYVFIGCESLTSISWPSNLNKINRGAFLDCDFKGNNYTLELPSSVNSIGAEAFNKLKHIILPSKSIVYIQKDSFTADMYLYVPANMVDMYKARDNWSRFADRIHPIEDYPVSE